MSMKFPDHFRLQRNGSYYYTDKGEPYGAFEIPGRHACGRELRVIANDGQETGWEHVSVSLAGRPDKCPSWDEMCLVKGLFWDKEDCVVQFHPSETEYINQHHGCLHMWRNIHEEIKTPPSFLVGIKL